ncbi:DUF2294 domain-containing protein [Planctellipticum variicoloris]|uniref:DUF2294 domain-containing protein n=1 Tax=Planctellipticum variicoloris TaxID=3064265 RepID=UPI002C2CD8E3|nr:DUF2294 domain-containing protein [Planctomycetaceae bacterium SH412]HTN02083.1 DUF2294 domain-containing protein [Planctomycetaceae bacterium]
MKSQYDIEAAIGIALTQFEQNYMGRGPKRIDIRLIDDCLLCRMHDVLTAVEQYLAKSTPPDTECNLLKEIRTRRIKAARPALESLVERITGNKVVSLQYDINTVSGDEIVLFVLAERLNNAGPAETARATTACGRAKPFPCSSDDPGER